MGWHPVPIRARSLEEAMATLGRPYLGVDVTKLTPGGIRESIANGEVASLDRVHALYGQIRYLWLAQGGKEATSDDATQDAFAIARRKASVLDLPEIAQPKSMADRRKKIRDSVLLARFFSGVTDPAALVCLFVPRLRTPDPMG